MNRTTIAIVAAAVLAAGFECAAGDRPCVDDFRAKAAALVAQMTLEEKVAQLQNHAPAIDRLGLPAYDLWSEALHGVARNGRATVFPEPIGMAATFDPELIKQVGEVIAEEGRIKYFECSSKGWRGQNAGLTFWSPNVNIFRDPRWGRGMETWGEDPFLTGTMGSAFIRGVQGDDPVYLKAAACAKHYAVHSGPERLRHGFDVHPSKKDLYETYLPAFEMCVKEGNVEAVMGAYNRVYGESASASSFLLKEILREKWGFQGHVVSDCGAVCDIWSGHHIVDTPPEAAALAIKNGLTVECGNCMANLVKAVELELVTEAEIDQALVQLLITRYKLGIIGDDPDCPYNSADPANLCCAEHRALARKVARESMVLLKNENGILPLNPHDGTYSICGAGSTDIYTLFGNYYGLSDHYVSYLEGIMGAVDPGILVGFAAGYLYGDGGFNTNVPWDGNTIIAVVGNTNAFEGEEGESIATGPMNGDRATLSLPAKQLEVIAHLKWQREECGKKVVVVVTGGSPIALQPVLDAADAVIFAWYAGEEGGNGLADVLFGKEDFTGRLPITFPVDESYLPPFEDYSMAGRGYRYMTDGILFPFGYGLSYAKFEYGEIEASAPKGADAKASVPVANTGDRDGTAVVQLYVSTPNAGKGHPIKQLVGFKRVPLKAGEKTTVEFTVPESRLTEVQEDGSRIRPDGEFKFSAM
ncbi:MAG: glycoside hydrolase family 3 C-terminal domain-containing protein [Kiritimatiellae bacterium]|nr:glycoside hydrolase family 3 C-terminal domain-containing protein [Kiritimatiellia bacterium]